MGNTAHKSLAGTWGGASNSASVSPCGGRTGPGNGSGKVLFPSRDKDASLWLLKAELFSGVRWG